MDTLLRRTALALSRTLCNRINSETAPENQKKIENADTKKIKKNPSRPPTKKGKHNDLDQGKQKRKSVSRKAKRENSKIHFTSDVDDIPKRRTFNGKYIRMSDVVTKSGQIFRVDYETRTPDLSSEILLKTKLENCLPSQKLMPQVFPSGTPSDSPPSTNLPGLKEIEECCKAPARGFWS